MAVIELLSEEEVARRRRMLAGWRHGQSGGWRRAPDGTNKVVYQTRTYACWRMMISQCENPRASGWAQHGGRGVKVCPWWRADFRNFLVDMGPRPDGMSIMRINPLGDYEPGNCQWVPSPHVRPEGVHRKRRTA